MAKFVSHNGTYFGWQKTLFGNTCKTTAITLLTGKCGLLKTPLQKIVTGGFLASAAFLISGGLEWELEKYYPKLPGKGQMVLSVHNGIDPSLGCDLGKFQLTLENKSSVELDLSQPHFLSQPLPEGSFTLRDKTVECFNPDQNFTLRFEPANWTKVFEVSKNVNKQQLIKFPLFH